MRASLEGDIEQVLRLMAEDVVFLLPGRPPIRSRDAFSATARQGAGQLAHAARGEHLVGLP